ncbi:MAG: hypothetical protein JO025_00085 [Verrucomicrobia bacterium]|nr:hypothetical protein [Verrucomicrobiota bacterium]
MRVVQKSAKTVGAHIREGRFQRSLALLAGASSLLGGAEVTYEHYKGSYGSRVMYSPVVLGGAMTVAGLWGAFSRTAARTLLRWVSLTTMLDGLLGFFFHIRGIARKPGGWRLPIANLIMGPPIFAPLLFAVSAYLGLVASFLRPEDSPPNGKLKFRAKKRRGAWETELPYGRFQKHLAVATIVGTFCSGFEALYSHYKNNFKYKVQWSPVILTPLLMGAAGASIKSAPIAKTWLPAFSLLAMLNGITGFFYHVRGVFRRPGGRKMLLYNTIYGPPIFAPLLFAACGFVGLLASLMRRERK